MAMVELARTRTADQQVHFHPVLDDSPVSGQWPPATLIDDYVAIAHRHRRTEQMEDGRWFAEVVGLPGVWADGDTEDQAADELRDVLEGWLRLKIDHGHNDIPSMEGIDLNLPSG